MGAELGGSSAAERAEAAATDLVDLLTPAAPWAPGSWQWWPQSQTNLARAAIAPANREGATHQPDDRCVAGKNAHDAVALDLAQVLIREVQLDEIFSIGVGHHVFPGGTHHRHGGGELLAQRLPDLLPVSSQLLRIFG